MAKDMISWMVNHEHSDGAAEATLLAAAGVFAFHYVVWEPSYKTTEPHGASFTGALIDSAKLH